MRESNPHPQGVNLVRFRYANRPILSPESRVIRPAGSPLTGLPSHRAGVPVALRSPGSRVKESGATGIRTQTTAVQKQRASHYTIAPEFSYKLQVES